MLFWRIINLKKDFITISVSIGVFILMIFLGYMSYNNKPEVFWGMNIANILTIGIAIYLSYYMTLKNSIKNRRKSRFESICNKIINITSNLCEIEMHDDPTKNRYLMSLRSLDNRIGLLLKFDKILDYSNVDTRNENSLCNDIKYLKSEYESLNEFIGNHITDFSFLHSSKIDMEKHLENINFTIDKILVNLEI